MQPTGEEELQNQTTTKPRENLPEEQDHSREKKNQWSTKDRDPIATLW